MYEGGMKEHMSNKVWVVLFMAVVYGQSGPPRRGPPELVEKVAADLVLVEGSTMSVTCNMTAWPRPIQYWYRNGRRMWSHHSPRYNITKTLTISHVVVTDSGSYECRGINQYGNKSVVLTLTVVPKANQTVVPSNTSATLGESVKLECSIILEHDVEQYNISWQKRYSLNETSSRVKAIKTKEPTPSAVLYLYNVTTEDAGFYTCTIYNEEGMEHCYYWLHVNPHVNHVNPHVNPRPVEEPVGNPDSNVTGLLTPVLIVVIAVVLAGVATVGVIYLYRRCRQKTSDEHTINYSVIVSET